MSDINDKYINKLKKNSKINKKLFVFNCDASDEYQVVNLFEKIRKKTQKIDCLINNVGIAGPTGTMKTRNFAPRGEPRASLLNGDCVFNCFRHLLVAWPAGPNKNTIFRGGPSRVPGPILILG